MFANLSMPVALVGVVAVILGVLWMTGTFSTRKQYRNKNAFSLEGTIQKNLTELNMEQIENQASSKFHYDDRITGNVLADGSRLDALYAEKKYRGPYGISTRSQTKKDEPVSAQVKDVEPDTPVEVDSSQINPTEDVLVKKEDVIATEKVAVKAKDVKPGETVLVKPTQVKPNQQVLKQSNVAGKSELVSKEDVDINENVVADSSQIDPEETVVVIASQVKPNKNVVAQGKSVSSDKKVVVPADKVKPNEVVVVKESDTKASASKKPVVAPVAGSPQIGKPAAADGIEVETAEPVSLSTVETRLAGDARFGKLYAMNKHPTKKAYTTVTTRQKLSEFPVRSTVHTSRII